MLDVSTLLEFASEPTGCTSTSSLSKAVTAAITQMMHETTQ
jgi:hypothetical protein